MPRMKVPEADDRRLRREYLGNDESACRVRVTWHDENEDIQLSSFGKYSAGVWGCKTPTAPSAKRNSP